MLGAHNRPRILCVRAASPRIASATSDRSIAHLTSHHILCAAAAVSSSVDFVDSLTPNFTEVTNEELLAALRRLVYDRYTAPPIAQLLQRQRTVYDET
jgi:hypothetical protein